MTTWLSFSTKHRSMRRELAHYIIGLSLLSALLFILSLVSYFEQGLQTASQTLILLETRAFEQKYRNNPQTPLPTSNTMHFYLDDWQHAPTLYQEAMASTPLQPNAFTRIDWDLKEGEHFADEQFVWALEELMDIEWDDKEPAQFADDHFFIVYWHKLPDKRDLYVVTHIQERLLTVEERNAFGQQFRQIFYLSGIYLLFVLIVVWFYNRRINHYTQKLADWADGLSLNQLSQPHPDFRYLELKRIAEQLTHAFQRIASLLEREHQFLRHASHELRTPIAITRANLDLLDKIGVPQPLARATDRIRRANHTMQQLTETLLWLSRENETPPCIHALKVDQLLEQLIDELSYLLQDKPEVSLQRQYPEQSAALLLPETPLRIVLSNLLRNAFQYTCEGEIVIALQADKVVIQNCANVELAVSSDTRFGLGLMLVERICQRLNWQLELQPCALGFRAELCLLMGSTVPSLRDMERLSSP